MKQTIKFINELGFKKVKFGIIAANRMARHFYEAHGWELVEDLPDGIEGVPIAIYIAYDSNSHPLTTQPASAL